MVNRLRWGMVGGGPGGIGGTHRFAAALDGKYELVAGVFSRDETKSAVMGRSLGVVPERVYRNFELMAEAESRRADGIHCVTICTPNDTHAPASIAFLERGIPVLCEKPMSTSVREAVSVLEAVERQRLPFGLTHNYSAYPMVLEANRLVREGQLGTIRVVQVEYALGSRSRLVEAAGDTRFAWRADPTIGGPSTVLGDIGSHAHHLMRFVAGLEVDAVSADLSTMVAGRAADDNADVNLRFAGGARGHLWASMVANGIGQGLRLRIYGERAGLHWNQEQPNELHFTAEEKPSWTLRRGEPWLGDEAKRGTRINRGQPEGYLEAFANVYRDFAEVVIAHREGRAPDPLASSFASARDGVLGMLFIEAAVESSRRDGMWVSAVMDR